MWDNKTYKQGVRKVLKFFGKLLNKLKVLLCVSWFIALLVIFAINRMDKISVIKINTTGVSIEIRS